MNIGGFLSECKGKSLKSFLNQFEVLASSVDNAECFAGNFSSLRDFPLITESLSPWVGGMHITQSIVSAIIAKLDPKKKTC